MTYEEALAFIHSTNWKGSRLGLERMRELLRRLGDPQRELKYVHVAGTNGKGSTSAMLASILRAAGYRTGLFTSPHLVRVNERIRIDGKEIADEDLIRAAEAVKAAVTGLEDVPTEFEINTAMGFWSFARLKCDIVVLEVGLGGRLDATNVIDAPEAAVITNLGLEHTEILGSTLARIAEEKAGILKPGCAAVAYRSEPEAMDVLARVCRERGVPLRVARFEELSVRERSLGGARFDWAKFRDLSLPLAGDYQLRNAVTALETVLVLRERGWSVSDAAVRQGMAECRWDARFQLLCPRPVFLADGAHNPQCVEALVQSLDQALPGEKIVFLTGVLADKDYERMMALLMPRAAAFVCLTPDSPRALPGEALAAWLRERGFPAEARSTAFDGILAALERAGDGPVVACGSLYMLGEILPAFPGAKKKALRRQAVAARRALAPEARIAADRAIVKRLCAGEAYEQADTLLVYAAMPGEADLASLKDRAEWDGKRLAYPRCLDGGRMEARVPEDEDAWVTGPLGIREPDPERSALLAPEEIDLVVCPCAGFDEAGHRLGMGGGFYDRYLPLCVNARIAAAAYEEQALAWVPSEPWDQDVDEIITQRRILRPEKKETQTP